MSKKTVDKSIKQLRNSVKVAEQFLESWLERPIDSCSTVIIDDIMKNIMESVKASAELEQEAQSSLSTDQVKRLVRKIATATADAKYEVLTEEFDAIKLRNILANKFCNRISARVSEII